MVPEFFRKVSHIAATKIDRIDKVIQKTRRKITEYQNKLKGIETQKTEAENLQIIQLVRSMHLTPQELTEFLNGDNDRNGKPAFRCGRREQVANPYL